MKDDSQTMTFMSTTLFVSEIMLVFMGLSGISVVGVHIGYFHSLQSLFVGLGLLVGILATVMCMIGVYVLLHQDYRRLKLYIMFLAFFVALQLACIIHLHFFISNNVLNDEQQGSTIALDVCFGLSASALVALCAQLKHKGSTIEMVKL
jgi:hypothetical protein